jgi:hypothetical protein
LIFDAKLAAAIGVFLAKKRNYPKHRKPVVNRGHLFKKGDPRPPNSGRKKGSKNAITRDIKEAMLQAFEALGGQQWLVRLGRGQKKSFAQLLGKMLPLQTGSDTPDDVADKIRAQMGSMNAATTPESVKK